MADVLDFLETWGAINDLPFNCLSWRTFALLLIFSCRRIGYLIFMGIDPPFMVLSEDSATLKLGFGLKQSRPNHCSPAVHSSVALDECLCPVRHSRTYLQASTQLRSSSALFITTMPPHDVAKHITLRQWFAHVMQGAGVHASPGSARAAVASTALARDVSENSVMEAADWASAGTLYTITFISYQLMLWRDHLFIMGLFRRLFYRHNVFN